MTYNLDHNQLHGLQPVHLVRDVSATVAYYRDVLGFEVDFVHGDPPIHARVVTGNQLTGNPVFIRFERAKATESVASSGYCYIHVAHDLDGLFEQYRQRGVHIEQELTSHEWGLRDFYIRDCNGYVFCFAAETPP